MKLDRRLGRRNSYTKEKHKIPLNKCGRNIEYSKATIRHGSYAR